MYPHEVYRSYLTPLRFLQRSTFIFRTRPAVIYGDRTLTYTELNERVHRLASSLRGIGVNKGDRVAVLLPNIPQMLEAHHGVPLSGGTLVAINTRLSSNDVAYILQHSGATVLIVDTEYGELIEPILASCPQLQIVINVEDVVTGKRLPGYDYEELLSSGSDHVTDWPIEDEDDVISINYTSGTTGRPKGVMYTHRGAYLNSLGEIIEAGLTTESVYLWTLPMFHCNGWSFPWAVVAIGGTQVCLRKFEAGLVWDIVRKQGVSHFCGAPTVLISLANHPNATEGPLARKLTVAVAAAPPSPQIIAQMESLGIEIVHFYGLTEVYGPYSVCEWQHEWDSLPVDEQSRLKSRQGVPYIVADDLRVVDDEMNDVPADGQTIGEVLMRGNNAMKGYYNDAEATEKAFRGGWFHSGDLAVMQPDGYVELRDRKKDIIISGGENISTIEVEIAIYAHPAVLEVAVIAIPDDYWGEVPKAFVTLRPGVTVTADEIIAHCRTHLAHYKVPRAIDFGELPKTSTGKIQKFVLRDKEWSDSSKRIH